MGKYHLLWDYVKENGSPSFKLTFLNCKKELLEYGYQVGKISMKEKTVIFNKII